MTYLALIFSITFAASLALAVIVRAAALRLRNRRPARRPQKTS